MKSAKLLALACIAYQERQFEEAGRLFSASMESEDCEDALVSLCEQVDVDVTEIQDEIESMIAESSSANIENLSDAVKVISESMYDEYASVAVEDEIEEDIIITEDSEESASSEEGTGLVINEVSSVIKRKSIE